MFQTIICVINVLCIRHYKVGVAAGFTVNRSEFVGPSLNCCYKGGSRFHARLIRIRSESGRSGTTRCTAREGRRAWGGREKSHAGPGSTPSSRLELHLPVLHTCVVGRPGVHLAALRLCADVNVELWGGSGYRPPAECRFPRTRHHNDVFVPDGSDFTYIQTHRTQLERDGGVLP